MKTLNRIIVAALIARGGAHLTNGADLSITAANVGEHAGGTFAWGEMTSGVAATPGQALYLDTTLKLADNDGSTTDDVVGIAVTQAASLEPCRYQTAGTVALGADTTESGEVYFLSGTAGGIMPVGDFSGFDEYVTFIGYGTKDGTGLVLDLFTSSVATTSGS